jgi:tRNA1(Val) A37 N6-methylase TrmN6
VLRPGETLDAIAGARIRLLQREAGYRFNLDAVLLARFAVERREAERPTKVIDLGTGCGIVALLLASWRPSWKVTAVEVQPSLADITRRNAALNELPVEVVESDWRTLGTPGRAGDADLITCNPPYFAPDRSQPCDDPEKHAARQEAHGTLLENAKAARRLVRGNGSVRFIHIAARLPELMAALAEAGLPVVRLRFVHAKTNEPAYAVLTESIPDSRRPLVVEPPLIVHAVNGGYTPDLDDVLTGRVVP